MTELGWFYFGLTIYFAIVFIHGAYRVGLEIGRESIMYKEVIIQTKRCDHKIVELHSYSRYSYSHVMTSPKDPKEVRSIILYELGVKMMHSVVPFLTLTEEKDDSGKMFKYGVKLKVLGK